MLFGITMTVALICVFALIAVIIVSHNKEDGNVEGEVLKEKILDCLPGENCGACGFSDCAMLAGKIADGEAESSSCPAGGIVTSQAISLVLGEKEHYETRMRAQIMCSARNRDVRQKYVYDTDSGVSDCIALMRLGGGEKSCKYACVGMGTCAEVCSFDAIEIHEGLAVVNPSKCTGCGRCVNICPKHLIKLIPYDTFNWVGCMSHDSDNRSKYNCGVGCTGCGECVKVCPENAVNLKGHLAEIDYDKCTGCDMCYKVCPEGIIWKADVVSGDELKVVHGFQHSRISR